MVTFGTYPKLYPASTSMERMKMQTFSSSSWWILKFLYLMKFPERYGWSQTLQNHKQDSQHTIPILQSLMEKAQFTHDLTSSLCPCTLFSCTLSPRGIIKDPKPSLCFRNIMSELSLGCHHPQSFKHLKDSLSLPQGLARVIPDNILCMLVLLGYIWSLYLAQ